MSKISDTLNVKRRRCNCTASAVNDPYWKDFAGKDTKSIDQNVEHPSHYKAANGMEAIDVIEAFKLDRDFCLGNCAKYLLRLGKKDNILQDAKKCRWYLDRYIQKLEKELNSPESQPKESCPKAVEAKHNWRPNTKIIGKIQTPEGCFPTSIDIATVRHDIPAYHGEVPSDYGM